MPSLLKPNFPNRNAEPSAAREAALGLRGGADRRSGGLYMILILSHAPYLKLP